MQELFRKYFDNQCSPQEVQELLQHFNIDDNEAVLKSLIAEQLEHHNENENQWKATTDKVYLSIKKQIGNKKGNVAPLFRRTWFRVAAAAVLVIGAFAIYKLGEKNKTNEPAIVKTNNVKQDIAPGGNKAVLTLADGSQIILDSAANGNLASQGNVKVIKLDNGQLAYNGSGSPLGDGGTEVLYNTITTPRGGQYQLVLADGTKVWLNAASSLRFPATFTGSERKVELTGEGYFEVAKNVAMPFKVDVAGKGEVEVLGTHFNINSYADEATINTTLLEGKVKVSATGSGFPTKNSRLLSPGQQALLNSNGQIAINKNPDIDEVMAWKNGKFVFGTAADISVVMRQVARWYNVDVVYEGAVPKQRFGGELLRNSSLVQVLEILKTSGVNYLIDGRKLIIRQ